MFDVCVVCILAVCAGLVIVLQPVAVVGDDHADDHVLGVLVYVVAVVSDADVFIVGG